MHRPSTFDFQLGLTGYPLSHSLSPKIHTAALTACGLKGKYSLFPIHPDDKLGLVDLLSAIRNGRLTGLNVTIPHKQNVIEYLDELTATAQSIGAVNTIYLREGKLIGDNTDASGFLLDVKRFLSQTTRENQHKNALILGAGGAARAVVHALVQDGWQVILTARRIEQAQQLADSLSTYPFPITVFELSNLEIDRQSPPCLIVNTTPVGMEPNIGQSPWPENVPFPAHAAIYDLVYNPGETKLVADARAQGVSATTGLGMLVEQAALAFELWTGHKPSREVMVQSVKQSPISNF